MKFVCMEVFVKLDPESGLIELAQGDQENYLMNAVQISVDQVDLISGWLQDLKRQFYLQFDGPAPEPKPEQPLLGDRLL